MNKIEEMEGRITEEYNDDSDPEYVVKETRLSPAKLAQVLVEIEERTVKKLGHEDMFTHRNDKCEYKGGYLAALEEVWEKSDFTDLADAKRLLNLIDELKKKVE